MKFSHLIILLTIGIICSTCEKTGGLNLFTKSQDIQFGAQLDSVIQNTPSEYTILSRTENPDAYAYLENMRDDILASNDIKNKDEFVWKITIIEDDILNAFAAPGGYMYFYTGMMKFLDNEAQLAGVMGHEIAHADRRHSTRTLTKHYTFDVLLSVLLGDNSSKLTEIAKGLATGLAGLAFSRDHESEADEFAVKYTADTDYWPKGVAGFFEKMSEAGNSSGTPAFLSTHPEHDTRIEDINTVWVEIGRPDGELFETEYDAFKSSLP